MEEKGTLLSARQISEAIEMDFVCVCRALRKMIKYREIQFVELDRNKSCEILGDSYVTRRMRFFFSIKIPEIQVPHLVDQLASLHSSGAE